MEIKILKKAITGKLVIGVDEAGRGPVVGPMVMASVGVPPLNIIELLEMGVEDSKKLDPRTRETLFEKILNLAEYVAVAVIPPRLIDDWVLNKKGLNALEALAVSRLLEEIPPNNKFRVYIDAPSNVESYVRYLEKNGVYNAIVENKADLYRPIVSAASIIAKVTRDRMIREIIEETGIDFGSGYPGDPKTKKHLRILLNKFPEYVRKSWKTVKKYDDSLGY